MSDLLAVVRSLPVSSGAVSSNPLCAIPPLHGALLELFALCIPYRTLGIAGKESSSHPDFHRTLLISLSFASSTLSSHFASSPSVSRCFATRCWASEDRKTLMLGATLAAVAVMMAIMLLGFMGTSRTVHAITSYHAKSHHL